MTVPVALEAFFRVIVSLEFQEVAYLGIASFQLFTRGPAMIGEVILSAAIDSKIN